MTAPTAKPAATKFGHAMRDLWALDPEILYLNHGTVGATPRRVLAAQQRLRDEAELQPSTFQLRELSAIVNGMPTGKRPRMRVAADAVAPFVGARGDDLVFVDNATAAANAILRSFDFKPGDEVLITDLGYGGVSNAARYAARRAGATVRLLETPFPLASPGDMTRATLDALGPKTRIAIVDHITSGSARVQPLAEIAVGCRAKGVAVLADGAHAPGAIPLDVSSFGVDWYIANLHKWAMAPRSVGFLWATPERQHDLHPPVISWGLDQGFTTEFDLIGTKDQSMALTAPDGISFMRDLGLEAMQAYNHSLALEAAHWIAKQWGVSLGVPDEMIGTMATIPLPERAGKTKDDANRLRDALLYEDRIEVQMHEWRGRVWARISAQVYTEMSDFERLAKAIAARI